jgi:hypothetical protein
MIFGGGGRAPAVPPGFLGLIVAIAVVILIVLVVKYVLDN